MSNEMIVLVQKIQVWWTKLSRGAPGSARRNAVPKVLELPLLEVKESTFRLLEHNVYFYEYENFQNPRESISTNGWFDTLSFDCVELRTQDNALRVMYKYDERYGGAPGRYGLPKEAFVIEPHQWGQLLYNGRFTSESVDWYYLQTTVNVRLCTKVPADVFTKSPPDLVSDQRVHLY